MATLPGMPQTDEPEPDALPVEPDGNAPLPMPPDAPGHLPVEVPKARADARVNHGFTGM